MENKILALELLKIARELTAARKPNWVNVFKKFAPLEEKLGMSVQDLSNVMNGLSNDNFSNGEDVLDSKELKRISGELDMALKDADKVSVVLKKIVAEIKTVRSKVVSAQKDAEKLEKTRVEEKAKENE